MKRNRLFTITSIMASSVLLLVPMHSSAAADGDDGSTKTGTHEIQVDPDPTDPSAGTQDSLEGPNVVEVEEVYLNPTTMQPLRRQPVAVGHAGSRLPSHARKSNESGSVGSSTASGCKTATVTNKKYSYSGTDHLYSYITKTSWCWNRSAKSVSSVSTDWDFYCDNGHIKWDGEANRDTYHYNWNGTWNSGYYHWRKGAFTNDFGPWTWGHSYPTNTIRSHSDGTWTWATTD